MNQTNQDPTVDDFVIAADDLSRLHARLGTAAAEQGLLDVSYRTIDSPVGDLLLAATPVGLVRVAFAREGFDNVLEILAERVSPRVLHHRHRLDPVARALEEYFSGHRTRFELPMDHALSGGFRAIVHRFLEQIQYGQTLTYQQVATAVGNPRAVRAVGTACATNPLPIVVPCHRVTRSDGAPGGYAGGPEAKARLLDLERTR